MAHTATMPVAAPVVPVQAAAVPAPVPQVLVEEGLVARAQVEEALTVSGPAALAHVASEASVVPVAGTPAAFVAPVAPAAYPLIRGSQSLNSPLLALVTSLQVKSTVSVSSTTVRCPSYWY